MSQTRKRSILESFTNIAVGLTLSLVAQFFMLHYLGYDVKWLDVGWISLWMTVLSILRSYTIRRLFSWYD